MKPKTDKQVLTETLKNAGIKSFKVLVSSGEIHVKNQSDVSKVGHLIETTKFKTFSIMYGFM